MVKPAEIEENIKLVDIVTILLDARAPFSCRNYDLEKIAGRKQMVLVLNKMDLASPQATRKYLEVLSREGRLAAAMDSTSGKGSKEVLQAIKKAFQETGADMLRRGRRVRAARVMIVGVPNIGKSTFLNCLVGQKMAAAGPRPGVTKGKQWVRVREDIEFLDTPGLMWPKVEDEEQGLKLALLNIVGENAYNEYDVALYLLKVLKQQASPAMMKKYKLDNLDVSEPELLEEIARKKGQLLKGGGVAVDSTCKILLQDFRKGLLGRISLD
jgi:ribosome biogenesis GTPase A